MAFSLTFGTDNAAFEDDHLAFEDRGRSNETARILRDVADRIEEGDIEGCVFDMNGNKVGAFTLGAR